MKWQTVGWTRETAFLGGAAFAYFFIKIQNIVNFILFL